MKNSHISAAALLALAFGFILPAFAGQDKPTQEHPKQQTTHQQARPQQQTHQQKPSAQTRRAPARQQRPAHPQQNQRAVAQQRTNQRQNQRAVAQQRTNQQQNQRAVAQQRTNQRQNQRAVAQQRTNQRQNQRAVAQQRTQQTQQFRQAAWQQHRAGNWQNDHRTWQQRGGYNGYRVPDARFRGYFGPDHGFRIQGLPFLVVGGYPRFQYGGYWMTVLDPYPENWGANWYDNDEVYVVYVDGGYYLYNRSYPGVGLAISFSL
ncbi:MAG: hypothetical protein WCA44_13185 [Acidobacteriaceae bacterium]